MQNSRDGACRDSSRVVYGACVELHSCGWIRSKLIRCKVANVATRKQVEANRRNAKLSSGPRTDEGKAVSKMNAIKHGLAAKSIVVPNLEDPDEWEAFRTGVIADLEPVGVLE